MCFYRFYVFLGCGHTTFSEKPVSFCGDARPKTAEEEVPVGAQGSEKTDTAKNRIDSAVVTASSAAEIGSGISSLLEPKDTSATPPTPPKSDAGDDLAFHTESKPEAAPEAPPAPKYTSRYKAKTKPERQYLTDPNLLACSEGRVHSLFTHKLDHLCAGCEYEKNQRLHMLEEILHEQEIRFEKEKWKFKYHGSK